MTLTWRLQHLNYRLDSNAPHYFWSLASTAKGNALVFFYTYSILHWGEKKFPRMWTAVKTRSAMRWAVGGWALNFVSELTGQQWLRTDTRYDEIIRGNPLLRVGVVSVLRSSEGIQPDFQTSPLFDYHYLHTAQDRLTLWFGDWKVENIKKINISFWNLKNSSQFKYTSPWILHYSRSWFPSGQHLSQSI